MANLALEIAAFSADEKRKLKERAGEFNFFPLSYGQERMWFLDQVRPGTPNYNMPAKIEFRGSLDPAGLEAALNAVVERHEALRTAFLELDGSPMQFIQPHEACRLQIIDLAGLPAGERDAECDRLALAEARRPFDLRAGHLFRAALIRLGQAHHVLMMTLHHIVSDDWSQGVLMRELSAAYRAHAQGAAAPPRPALQYVDFASWQRESLQGAKLEQLAAFWRARLALAPELLALPLDRPRPAVQTFAGARLEFGVDADVLERIERLGRERDATPFMVLLAVFKILLQQRYSGQDDVVVATPIANRTGPELEEVIGLFFNTLVLRTDLSGDPTFTELLGRVRAGALEAYAHQDLPFVKLVELLRPERALSHNPLVQAMFILQNAPREAFELPGLSAEIREVDNGTAQFDLIVSLRKQGPGLAGYVHYNTDIFAASTMSRLIGHFKRLLASVAAAPGERIRALEMLTPAEWHKVRAAWNDTAAARERNVCLHRLVEARAAAAPDAVAVIAGGRRIRYGELEARANQLAHHLSALGARPGANVGICIRPGADAVVALLATVKTGSAYVPLDPNYPADRLEFMLSDARIAALVTEEPLLPRLPGGARAVVCVDSEAERIARRPTAPLPASPGDEHLAYVIYTSGTTGRPKGVMIRHAGIVNNLLDLNHTFKVGPEDRILALSSFSFDMSVYETFGILAAGGAVVVPERDRLRDPAHWVELILEHGVTLWNSAPALLEMLVRHCASAPGLALPTLRAAILGGDWVAVSLPQRLARVAPRVSFVVLGGATEASIHSIIYPVEQVDPGWASIPYGKPMVNQRAYVLDPTLRPVPVGVPGELYLGGLGLARGYFARPALTAEKFLPDPYADAPGARLYRTGDLARYGEDGTILLIGRIDHQVKIRGHRIELGEIESVLREHPAVKQAVVAARPDATGEKRLVAYWVPGSAAHPEALAAHARAKLPGYMVPADFVMLERLPLSPNGKVDRAALPAPSRPAAAEAPAAEAQASALERLLASLFAEVLGAEQVGLQDDFFDLGGHSLRATQLVSQVRELLQMELPLRTFLEAPNVASLAAAVERMAADRGVALEPILAAVDELS